SAKSHTRAKRGQSPTADQRTNNCCYRAERFARPDLMAAMFGISQHRKIGMVRRPIERVADCRTDAESEQHDIHAADFCEEQILYTGENRSEGNECSKSSPGCKHKNQWPNEKAHGNHECN